MGVATLRLYDRRRSGNCYRVRLMLGFLGLSYERIPINIGGAASIAIWAVSRNANKMW